MTWVQSLEEGTVTHSSILAWKIPQSEEPGGLESMGCHKESDTPENAGAGLDLCTVSKRQSSADNKQTQVS